MGALLLYIFSKEGYILALDDFEKLGEVLEKVKVFKPKRFVSNTDNFIEHLKNYID